jgi:MFS family permease
MLRSGDGHFRPVGHTLGRPSRRHFWSDNIEGLRYIRHTPFVFAIGMAGVGWASGGGAAQILFTLYGEVVYRGGPAAVGWIWGSAGIGLVLGGVLALRISKGLSFRGYKNAISVLFAIHGISYVLFSQAPGIAWAIVFIMLSRIGMGANNVLNRNVLLTHVPDRYRGRVFTTVETMTQATMLLSLTVASVATKYIAIRTIGLVAGCLSASTALFWALANWTGKLVEPPPDRDEVRQETPQSC